MIYNLLSKFHVRHQGFSFYDPRKSDEGADTDLIIFAGLMQVCQRIWPQHQVVCPVQTLECSSLRKTLLTFDEV